jgi:site-specific DNA recombinase
MVQRPVNGARYAIYARFSSDKQSDASIEDQVHRARERIASLGGNPQSALVFTDYALSGASMERPGVQALLKALGNGEVDVVVTESVDRISRRSADAMGFRDTLAYNRIALECLDGTRIGADDKNSLLTYGLRSLMSQQYLADLADKTLRGLQGRARQGLATGTVPYG